MTSMVKSPDFKIGEEEARAYIQDMSGIKETLEGYGDLTKSGEFWGFTISNHSLGASVVENEFNAFTTGVQVKSKDVTESAQSLADAMTGLLESTEAIDETMAKALTDAFGDGPWNSSGTDNTDSGGDTNTGGTDTGGDTNTSGTDSGGDTNTSGTDTGGNTNTSGGKTQVSLDSGNDGGGETYTPSTQTYQPYQGGTTDGGGATTQIPLSADSGITATGATLATGAVTGATLTSDSAGNVSANTSGDGNYYVNYGAIYNGDVYNYNGPVYMNSDGTATPIDSDAVSVSVDSDDGYATNTTNDPISFSLETDTTDSGLPTASQQTNQPITRVVDSLSLDTDTSSSFADNTGTVSSIAEPAASPTTEQFTFGGSDAAVSGDSGTYSPFTGSAGSGASGASGSYDFGGGSDTGTASSFALGGLGDDAGSVALDPGIAADADAPAIPDGGVGPTPIADVASAHAAGAGMSSLASMPLDAGAGSAAGLAAAVGMSGAGASGGWGTPQVAGAATAGTAALGVAAALVARKAIKDKEDSSSPGNLSVITDGPGFLPQTGPDAAGDEAATITDDMDAAEVLSAFFQE